MSKKAASQSHLRKTTRACTVIADFLSLFFVATCFQAVPRATAVKTGRGPLPEAARSGLCTQTLMIGPERNAQVDSHLAVARC